MFVLLLAASAMAQFSINPSVPTQCLFAAAGSFMPLLQQCGINALLTGSLTSSASLPELQAGLVPILNQVCSTSCGSAIATFVNAASGPCGTNGIITTSVPTSLGPIALGTISSATNGKISWSVQDIANVFGVVSAIACAVAPLPAIPTSIDTPAVNANFCIVDEIQNYVNSGAVANTGVSIPTTGISFSQIFAVAKECNSCISLQLQAFNNLSPSNYLNLGAAGVSSYIGNGIASQLYIKLQELLTVIQPLCMAQQVGAAVPAIAGPVGSIVGGIGAPITSIVEGMTTAASGLIQQASSTPPQSNDGFSVKSVGMEHALLAFGLVWIAAVMF